MKLDTTFITETTINLINCSQIKYYSDEFITLVSTQDVYFSYDNINYPCQSSIVEFSTPMPEDKFINTIHNNSENTYYATVVQTPLNLFLKFYVPPTIKSIEIINENSEVMFRLVNQTSKEINDLMNEYYEISNLNYDIDESKFERVIAISDETINGNNYICQTHILHEEQHWNEISFNISSINYKNFISEALLMALCRQKNAEVIGQCMVLDTFDKYYIGGIYGI